MAVGYYRILGVLWLVVQRRLLVRASCWRTSENCRNTRSHFHSLHPQLPTPTRNTCRETKPTSWLSDLPPKQARDTENWKWIIPSQRNRRWKVRAFNRFWHQSCQTLRRYPMQRTTGSSCAGVFGNIESGLGIIPNPAIILLLLFSPHLRCKVRRGFKPPPHS